MVNHSPFITFSFDYNNNNNKNNNNNNKYNKDGNHHISANAKGENGGVPFLMIEPLPPSFRLTTSAFKLKPAFFNNNNNINNNNIDNNDDNSVG